jgi:hypothetical protein
MLETPITTSPVVGLSGLEQPIGRVRRRVVRRRDRRRMVIRMLYLAFARWAGASRFS